MNMNMNMSACNPTSIMEAHSNPVTPFYGGFANDHSHHSVTLEPNKNKVICKFSQKTMSVHPSQTSCSKSSPLPFSLFNNCGLEMMSDFLWDTDQNAKVKNDTNIANHHIIKGQWTPEEDRALVELKGSWSLEEDMILIKGHQEFGRKWSKIAKRLSGRTENDIKNRWNATIRRQNCNKNSQTHYKGSLLHAYVKWVTATEDKLLRKPSHKKNKNVLGCTCDELALLLS
ncbi:hypothetical protein V8G54_011020 [Vigna mungo]|uniref:Uncharacterized protein n=1 Tax=Vigna mungo TaxID=3915 RepID=A0AAQ3NN83_VIGMU